MSARRRCRPPHPSLILTMIAFFTVVTMILTPQLGSLASAIPQSENFSTETDVADAKRDFAANDGVNEAMIVLPTPTATQFVIVKPPVQLFPTPTPTAPPTRPTETPPVLGRPTEEPTVEPTTEVDAPEEAPTDVPPVISLDVVAELTATLHICPEGYNPLTETDPAVDCTQTYDGATFTLDGSMPTTPDLQAATGAAVGGTALFPEVRFGDFKPRDDFVLSLFPPPGYGTTFLWSCRDEANLATFNPPVLSLSNAFPMHIGSGSRIVCDWYITIAPTTYTVTLDKLLCPAGTDRLADRAVLEAQCTEPMPDIEFEVFGDDDLPGVTDANGHIEWPNVEPDGVGRIGIGEEVPPGFGEPAVWCMYEPDVVTGPPGDTWFSIDPSGGWFERAPESHHQICTYYNIPSDPADHVLTLYKFNCPLDVDYFEVEDECPTPGDGVEFTVSGPNGTETKSTVDGQATFNGIVGGVYMVEEAFPDGFSLSRVTCEGSGLWLGTGASLEYPSFKLDLEGANLPFVCVVYDLQLETEGTGDILVEKRYCPSGLDPDLFVDLLANECDLPGPEIDVTISVPTDSYAQTQTTAQSQNGQETSFTDVPIGLTEIQETIPDGYGQPRVFCSSSIDSFGFLNEMEPDANGRFIWDRAFLETPDVRCRIYNFVEPSNAVELHKWECPDGFAGTTWDEYFQTCTDQQDGVTFTLNSSEGQTAEDTVGGLIEFQNLPSGDISIQESIPGGYGQPWAACGPDGSIQEVDVTNGYLEHSFVGEGNTLICHWFNVPGDVPSITVNKWTCPPGYAPFAMGSLFQVDCQPAPDGIEFQLTPDGSDVIARTQLTGEVIPNGVVFDVLMPGQWTITEVVPEGIAQVYVLGCYGFINAQLQPYPLSETNTVSVDLDPDELVTCDWLNIQADPASDLKVTKYICTGETYLSDIDCQIEESGVAFELLKWDGNAWQVVDTGITDDFGNLSWTDLEAGDYWLAEPDGEWCHIRSGQMSADETRVVVEENVDASIEVFNCGGEPGDQGETPTEYPETGVPPTGDRPKP